MPLVNDTKRNFAGGELSVSVAARGDIKVYSNGCERIENFLPETVGPIKFRTGTKFCNPTRRNAVARFIPFQFSDKQAYLIEVTPGWFRFYKDNGIIVDDVKDKTISAITAASPAVVTMAGHGLANGNEVFINGVTGTMKSLNGKSFVIKDVTSDTFALYDDEEKPIDTSGLEYSSSGTVSKIVEVENPYTDTEGKTDEEILEYLNEIQYTQNTDTMIMVHQKYPPRKLTRSSHTSWTFKTYERTSDYMTGPGKYPGAVAFDGNGRLIFGGFEDEPDLLLMSRGPDSKTGNTRYDDFTTGTLANDAIKMYLAPANGKVIVVKWLAVNNRYFLVGTESGLIRITSSDGYDSAFSAETLPIARPIDSYGCAKAKPVPKGNLLFYLQKGSLIFRCLEYDLVYDSYKSVDKNLIADRITSGGCLEMAFQSGRPDVIWIPKKNGILIGLTYHETEDVAAWHRTIIGGKNTKVLSVGIMPRADKFDQSWLIVERLINGKIKRYVEFFADFEEFLSKEDFYTDSENEVEDTERYNNDMFERQKLECHLDCSMMYDGADIGTNAEATLSITEHEDDELFTVTSDKDIFAESDLDRQIWRIHEKGYGSGRMSIVEFTDSKTVICKLLRAFDTMTLTPGLWALTTDHIKGLEHLEGETVSVVTDGAVHTDCIVENGEIKLTAQADVIHVGYKYRGLIKTTNLNIGGTSGSAQNKARNVYKVIFEFLNSLGVKFGTNLYRLTKLDFRGVNSRLNRPSPLYSGPKEKVFDDKTEWRKHCYIVQDSPLPCTIQAIDVYMEVVDD